MTKPIDAQMVEARMRDLGQTIVTQTISLFKGGIFALAAVLLLDIATQSDGRLMRLLMWSASFGLALTSYNAWLNGSVTDFRETVGSVVLMVSQMMAELMLFAVLTPRFSEQAWRGWVLLYGIFMLFTAATMLTDKSRAVEVDANLRPMLDTLTRGNRRAGWNLFGFAVLALIVSVPILLLPRTSPWPEWLTVVMAIFVAATSAFGLIGMHHSRVAMERMLKEALADETVS